MIKFSVLLIILLSVEWESAGPAPRLMGSVFVLMDRFSKGCQDNVTNFLQILLFL
jgi:hypothetical protein